MKGHCTGCLVRRSFQLYPAIRLNYRLCSEVVLGYRLGCTAGWYHRWALSLPSITFVFPDKRLYLIVRLDC